MRFRAPVFGCLLTLALAAGCTQQPGVDSQAALLVDAGQPRQAEALLREHLTRHPEAIAERRQLVRVLGVLGDLEAAAGEAAVLSERLGSESPIPWIELGHAHELAHRYDEALALYDRAAELAPRDPAGPRAGGLRAARWGELGWAEPRLSEAARRDPRDLEVWHALGLVRVHQGRFEDAIRAYQSGLAIDPRAAEFHIGLATVALRRGKPAEALHHYDSLAALRPEDGDVQLGRAYALLLLGRISEARHAVDGARRRGADGAVIERLTNAIEQGAHTSAPVPDEQR